MKRRPQANSMEFETRAIHSGQPPDSKTGAVSMPISLASTFEQDAIGKHRGYEYIREQNPTRQALEICFADLENAESSFAFSSGIAAIDSVLRLLNPGDHILILGIVYGGTIKLLQNVYARMGISFDIADSGNLREAEAAIKDNTRLIWTESPANPLFNIVDIKRVVEIARAQNIISALDSTVATPYLQNPLDLGVDIVVHSATKYLGGHSDILGGLAATNSKEMAEHIKGVQNAAGAVLSPFDSYLVLRGIKTLAVRMQRHCQNAMAVAEMLEAHSKVEKVNYSGLKSHPDHKLAKSQMKDFSGMMSFNLKGGRAEVETLVTNTRLFTFAESLGAVESLISYPPEMSHAVLKDTKWAIEENLIRLSVGIENQADLLADLEQALEKV